MGKPNVTVIGDKALKRTMEQLPKRVQGKIIRKGLRKSMKLVADRARALVPKRTGRLRKSIKVRSGKRSRNKISIIAQTGEGFFKGDTYYGGFVEYGTEKMEAQPFLRPAFDQKEVEAGNIVEAEIELFANEAWKEGK